ncbi:hypothetical protein N7532_008646 [Penicillium argentinense]|uniref:Tr-type G domain-containing protein n=1 Tax=Penicillium argentinense TaxID=1131581 RepID=A0A9W9EXT9_9EURO|nr:uncharacterized protein N7532_008646 [Penicillium argentinense]KAJ5089962.1 hypothetical protein N7532_008646 [Penicillium argentinense]
MASIFTYDPDPPRVSSPWSTSGSSTPQLAAASGRGVSRRTRSSASLDRAGADILSDYGISKLEPEPQEGPTEYKLHLLLRPRRPYLAMSTGNVVVGSYHSRLSQFTPAQVPSPAQDATTPRPMQAKSSQSRQSRLTGLTTQLLWRLQQSSPFHSTTTANLVIPVRPEATPQLGVPSKPARLLPGLEESQGALYEIGVADDGTFVGLTLDELNESVTNLQAMAASLGCKVEILRRVIVGNCEWAEGCPPVQAEQPTAPPESLNAPPKPIKSKKESLWVAEALVSPDLDFYNLSPALTRCNTDDTSKPESDVNPDSEENYSRTEQIRISLAGPSAAGKSSLLGTLTSSALDNGRGSSRLSLLKHRHEISSGITSSVAQELIGYGEDEHPSVVNYASGNVAAWDDIHAASRNGRLAFVSDLPGSVRYMKSTLRGLVSWAPHYVLLCIPANCGAETPEAEAGAEQVGELDLCLAYLELCLKLEVPVLVVITKLDVAAHIKLRENVAKVLSAVKSAGCKPAILPGSPSGDKALDLQQVSTADRNEVQKVIDSANGNWCRTIPIVLSSAVDGTGIGKLHAFMRYLPVPQRPSQQIPRLPKPTAPEQKATNIFDVDEVFAIPPSKVYSIALGKNDNASRGMVLCGLVRQGSIAIGDEMTLGPILVDTTTDSEKDPTPLSLSRSSAPGPSAEFPASFAANVLTNAQAKWQRVRVVSVRDLRLPVHRLKQDQVGTVGIELITPSSEEGRLPRISRIRKGMILTNFNAPMNSLLPPRFPFAFSAPKSPPLLLGGNAIAYIASIRTTVRVVCMALAGPNEEPASSPPSPSEPEFFSFDGDSSPSLGPEKRNGGDQSKGGDRRRQSTTDISKVVSNSVSMNGAGNAASNLKAFSEDVKITFAFVTSVEWIELGSRVLVMPGVSMGPSSGVATTGPGSGTGVVPMSGLEGFVGTVCDVVKAPGGN